MKKLKIILVFSLTICLTSCFMKQKDITRMLFPISAIISNKNDKYQLYILVLSYSLSSKIELENGVDDSLFSVVKTEGDTITDASVKLGGITDGHVSSMKIRSVVLHSSVFENQNFNYKDFTAYFINNPLYRSNVALYYSQDEPEELLNLNSLSYTTDTDFFLARPNDAYFESFLYPPTLISTGKSYLDNKRMFYLPSLTTTNKQFMQEKDGKLKEVISHTLNGALFLKKDGSFQFIELDKLNGLRWKSQEEYFDLIFTDTAKPLDLKIEKLSWNQSIKDNKIIVQVKAIAKILYNYTELSISQLEEKLKNYIIKEITDTYTALYKDIDIYLFEDFAYRLNKKIEDFSFFNLEVTATIKNTIYQY